MRYFGPSYFGSNQWASNFFGGAGVVPPSDCTATVDYDAAIDYDAPIGYDCITTTPVPPVVIVHRGAGWIKRPRPLDFTELIEAMERERKRRRRDEEELVLVQ